MKLTIEPLPIHPVACCWPEDMTGPDWEDFCQDIKEYGLKVAIETWQGQVIDGRRRQTACFLMGVLPVYHEWDGKGSMTSHVASLNFHRRDLDPETKDLVAARLIPFFEAECLGRMQAGTLASAAARGKAAEQAAKATGSSRAGAERARKVLKKGGKQLVQALENGKVSTSKAARLADLSPREQVKMIAAEGKAVRKKSANRQRLETIAAAGKALAKAAKLLATLGDEAADLVERVEIVQGLLTEL